MGKIGDMKHGGSTGVIRRKDESTLKFKMEKVVIIYSNIVHVVRRSCEYVRPLVANEK